MLQCRQPGLFVLAVALSAVLFPIASRAQDSPPPAVELWLTAPGPVKEGLPPRIAFDRLGADGLRVLSPTAGARQLFRTDVPNNALRIWIIATSDGAVRIYFAYSDGEGGTRYLVRHLRLDPAWGEVELEQLAEVVQASGAALAEEIVGDAELARIELPEEEPPSAPVTPVASPSPSDPPVRASPPSEPEADQAVSESPWGEAIGLGPRARLGGPASWAVGLQVAGDITRTWGNTRCGLELGGGIDVPRRVQTGDATLSFSRLDVRLTTLCGPRLGRLVVLGGVGAVALRQSVAVEQWRGPLPARTISRWFWQSGVLLGGEVRWQLAPIVLGLSAWTQRNQRAIDFTVRENGATHVVASIGHWGGEAALRLLVPF